MEEGINLSTEERAHQLTQRGRDNIFTTAAGQGCLHIPSELRDHLSIMENHGPHVPGGELRVELHSQHSFPGGEGLRGRSRG